MSKKLLALLLILSLSIFIASCGDDDEGPTGSGTGVSEFEVLQSSLDAYTGGTKAPVIKAQDLQENLYDGDESNDPVVLSVRSSADYATGHIPGAINISWKEIGNSANLAVLPKDRQIVVYCYTGHTGGVATTALNALSYDAVNLMFGIMSWTQNPDVRVKAAFSEETDAHSFAIETTENTAGTHDLPTPDYTASDLEEDILIAAINAYVGGDKAPVIKAQALFDNLNDGEPSNDPVVLSVRGSADYAIGHIPGAINISWKEISKVESLEKLPTDRQIVVYCYTGHTGAVATTALNMLGYDAINLMHGMMSWTQDPNVRVKTAFSEETDAHDFPVE